jgi:hypothetical protein
MPATAAEAIAALAACLVSGGVYVGDGGGY